MAYRQDPDLEFLKNCKSKDLDTLVTILTKNKNGEPRLTEELTRNARFIQHNPNHHLYWDLIAEEIQKFGGNTIANFLRGDEGVLYREVLTDACEKMKVNFNKSDSVEIIEMNLLMKILTDSISMSDMTPEQIRIIAKDLELNTNDFSKQALIVALQALIKSGGFTSYKIAVIVANAVAKAILGRGLSIAANASLTRLMGLFAGPIGIFLTATWTAIDILGPAYRVTIPSVIQVALMRQELKNRDL